jgi:prolyl-tRNA editing enzyme YbaK/EbsC (Cys-tRNA(Pro) deacylase)
MAARRRDHVTDEGSELSRSARRVQDALAELGFDLSVTELPQSTRSARDAALAVGCEVGQIAKSLVFRRRAGGGAVLVIASGANRVDEARLSEEVGEPVRISTAEEVRRQTGFAIGGVPPLGHLTPIPTYIDEDLLAYGEIWAAAGTPNAVFRLEPADLVRMTDGQIIKLRQIT